MNPLGLYTYEIIQLQSLGVLDDWLKVLDNKARMLLKDRYQEFVDKGYIRTALRHALSHGLEGDEIKEILDKVVEEFVRVKK